MKTTSMSETSVTGWRMPLVASLAMFCSAAFLPAVEEMKMPEPVQQHQWLERFVGEWESEGECYVDPAKPAKINGSEKAHRLGKFWVMAKGKAKMGEMEMENVFTLGFDPRKGKFVGTWVDSMNDTLWTYEGSLSEDGNTLTLNSEGYCPMHKKVMSFKEVIEFKSEDEKVFTSMMKGDDGEWTKMVSVTSKRKKMEPAASP